MSGLSLDDCLLSGDCDSDQPTRGARFWRVGGFADCSGTSDWDSMRLRGARGWVLVLATAVVAAGLGVVPGVVGARSAAATTSNAVAGGGSGGTAAAITTGFNHTCALMSGGGVKCWGLNYTGQLGDGSRTNSTTPVRVVGLGSAVTAITAGQVHSCALMSVGGVRCWGYNAFGQLGDGSRADSTTPVRVVGLGSAVTAIAAGGNYTCALMTAGGVKCWGLNSAGQLGARHTYLSAKPVRVVGLDGRAIAITAGNVQTCALMSDGGVKCWGANNSGQLGDGTHTFSSTPVDVVGLGGAATAITSRNFYTCALMSHGPVRCWGDNRYGQLGDGTYDSSSTPTRVVRLRAGATAISAGLGHTCALMAGGGVKCWGLNWNGELGTGTTVPRDVPTPVDVVGLNGAVTAIESSWTHTCALLAGGGVQCWGYNHFGQLGDGTTGRRVPTPVEVVGF